MELAGAVAAIVINTVDQAVETSGLSRIGADASKLGVTLLMISKKAGAALQAAVKINTELRVRVRTHAWVAEGAQLLVPVAGP